MDVKSSDFSFFGFGPGKKEMLSTTKYARRKEVLNATTQRMYGRFTLKDIMLVDD